MENEGKRIKWIDVSKGIAIIAMVLGHMPGIPPLLRAIIFSFHMPLFMIVNGFLIHDYDVKKNFSRSVNSLVRPYVYICLIEAGVSMLTASSVDEAGRLLFMGLDDLVLGLSFTSKIFTNHGSVWIVWFVICLFFSRNIYIAIRALTKKAHYSIVCLSVIMISLSGYFIGNVFQVYLPWSLDIALYSVLFIAAGDYIKQREIIEKSNLYTLILPVVLWIGYLTTGTHIELATRNYPFVFGGALCAIIASIFIFKVSKYIGEKTRTASKVLSWYGRYSLQLLCVHCIELRFLKWDIWLFNPLGLENKWIIQAIIRVLIDLVITYVIVYILNKYKLYRNSVRGNMEYSITNNRIEWADSAKGICIIAVIAGHMGVDFINQTVFLWHLPVFFLIAGYFFRPTSSGDLIRGKSLRLLKPYYLTCVVICILCTIKTAIVGKEIIPELKRWIQATLYAAGDNWTEPFAINGIGAIWFLWAMFIAIFLVNLFINRKGGVLIIALIAVTGWASFNYSGIWLPLSIQAGMLCSLYILIGYKISRYEYEIESMSPVICMLFCIIAAIGIQQFAGFWLVHDYMGHGWIDFFVSICASIVIIIFANWINKKDEVIKTILMFFGKNSLLILCLHIIDLNVLSISRLTWKFFETVPIIHNALYITIIILVLKIVYVVIGTLLLRRFNRIKEIFS